MNKVFLIGRLTGDPEAKQTPSGVSVTTFNLAINRRFNRELTDYIPIVTWRGLAENCAKYLVKGQQAAVSGELQTRRYEDKDGNKRTAFEVVAEDVEFLSKASGHKEHSDSSEAFAREMGAEIIDDLLPDDERLPFD